MMVGVRRRAWAVGASVALVALGGWCGPAQAVTQNAAVNSETALWVARYNGPGNSRDVARAVAVAPDGATAIVTGDSVGATSGHDYATVAYNTTTGAKRWVARYNGPGNSVDFARSVAVTPDGATVLVTGYSVG